MSDPTDKYKPYRTGALPKTAAEKKNVHLGPGGWQRSITADDYAWAGNDNTSSTPEVLVAFNGLEETGWYAYNHWATPTHSAGAHLPIDLHIHFNEGVDITGTPTCRINNGQQGSGTLAFILASFVSMLPGYTHIALFRTANPSLNQFKAGDVMYLPANALALAGGTIKDAGTNTATQISSAADKGYRGTYNKNGNANHLNTTVPPVGSRVLWVT